MPKRSDDPVRPDVVPWRDHDFVHLWIAQASGLVGQQFSVLAMPLVAILTLHAPAATVALLSTSFGLPWVIFGLFVGVVVDRFSRRSALILSDLVRAALLACVPVAAALGRLTMSELFVLAILIGTFDMIWMTAYRSYVPNVVTPAHLDQGYSATGASDAVSRTTIPSIAGAIIQLLGPPAGAAVTSCAYLVSAISNVTIRRREAGPGVRRHDPILRSFLDGVRYTCRQHVVRTLAISDGLYIFFWAATRSVTLVFLNRHLGLSAGVIGAIYSLGAIGGLVAAFGARRIGLRIGTGRSIVTGSMLRSAGMAALPVAIIAGPLAVPVVAASTFINAVGWTLWDVHQETTKQRLIPDALRGRVNGSIQFVSGTALALGSAAGAGLVTVVNLDLTLAVCAGATLIACLWLVPNRVWSLTTRQSQQC